MATRIAQTDLARDALYTKVNQMYDEKVSLTGDETITGTKTFSSAIKRSSSIDQTATTGEVEVSSISVVDKDNRSVGSYNTTRSSTTNTNRQRVTNANVTGAGWFDLRVNVNDSGKGWVTIAKGSGITTNGSLSDVSSSTSDADIPTKGWVNNPSTSTNVVHRSGDETISGTKTFQGTGWITHIKNTSVTYNTAPSSNTTTAISFVDKDSQSMGAVECFRNTDNSTITQLNAYSANGNWAKTSLALQVKSDGTCFALCPTPTDTISTSSKQIATVGWVNSANNNVVHKTGQETINNEKIFTANLIRAHTDITKGTNPSSPLYWGVEFIDKNGPAAVNRLGLLETKLNTNGDVETYIASYLNTNGSRDQTALKIVYKKDGNKYAIAPASDVIDSIVTTVNKSKSKNGYFKLGNGLIVQWGYSSASGENLSITFPTPFSSTNYGMGLTVNSDYGGAIWISEMSVTNRSTTGFKYGNSSKAHPFSWVAIGY